MLGDNKHMVFDSKGIPLYYTISDTGTTARKKAESRTMKTWKQLEKAKYTCLNIDITISLRA